MTPPDDTGLVRPSILLVDDKPQRLLTYVAILESLELGIVMAGSGKEALERIEETDFAAILLDVNMPGLNGFETASRIRKHPRSAQTPIVFVTGIHVTDLDRIRGYSVGATDYVFVPVVPEILRAKIRVLAQLYAQQQEMALLNEKLVATNEELARAHARLRADNMRELKKLNESLALTNSKLQAEIRERHRMEEKLKQAAQRKDRFISILAHELRNPLSAIHSGIELIRMRTLPDAKREWAGRLVERQLGHLVRLIEDLLDVSRITNGRVQIKKEVIDVRTVIMESLDAARPQIEARRHEVVVELPDEPLHVDGDAVRLGQVFGNLLANASKYMDERGRIDISAGVSTADPRRISVRVKDRGVGLREDVLEHIFELFAQVKPAGNSAQGGLGIGLALVRSLVELHDGFVRASSDGPGLGSEFIVDLPLCESLPSSGVRQRERVRLPPMRLLIVDDNVDAARGLAQLFTEHAPHVIELAHDGTSGVTTAERFEPEAVFLDIGLPDIDGYEVARRIRALDGLGSTPIIAITGFGRDADPERHDGTCFDGFLTKPVALPDLERVLFRCKGHPSVPGHGGAAAARTAPL